MKSLVEVIIGIQFSVFSFGFSVLGFQFSVISSWFSALNFQFTGFSISAISSVCSSHLLWSK